jgi:hypothetical protein
MRNIFILYVLFILGMANMSNAVESSSDQNKLFAEAFDKAKLEVKDNLEKSYDKARSEARFLGDNLSQQSSGIPGITLSMKCSKTWQSVAVETRNIAEKLAKEQGNEIAPYLMDRVEKELDSQIFDENSQLLTLLILDALGKHNEAAKLGILFFTKSKYKYHALFEISFCSSKTREKTANLLAEKLLNDDSVRVSWTWDLDFMVASGNTETMELLNKKKIKLEEEFQKSKSNKHISSQKRDSWQQDKQNYEQAVNQIKAKLSLPQIKRDQRTKDELLFWQTFRSNIPAPVNAEGGLKFQVECLSIQKLTISTEYLVEQLDQATDEKHANWQRVKLALLFIASQKENDAVPAMVNLARRMPNFQKDVVEALKALDTPDAQKAVEHRTHTQ